jgi:isoaspartyl peptidase/L-asparaginase-like protein (Ntn-hydrolase superfamily)
MKIIIHGGFFSESGTNQEVKKAKQEALKEIVEAGYKHLAAYSALETAVYTVCLPAPARRYKATAKYGSAPRLWTAKT